MSSHRRRQYRVLTIFAPATALLAFALLVGLPTRDASATPSARCIASLSPDSVPIQSESAIVGFMLPDSLGTVASVTAPEDSGIEVGTIDTENETVELMTVNATAGSWTLTFTGDSARTCAGVVNVVEMKRRR